MRRLGKLLAPPAAWLLLPAALAACLWDSDTLYQERERFPSTLELVTGKFLRHSPEFYEWRRADRLEKLRYDPDNLALRDDLAVALDKLGRHEEAIEAMLVSHEKDPGRYETLANLGTFYIHAGKPEKGLPFIDEAIAVNPDAHFGREKYQKYLVEYVLSRRQDGKVPIPLRPEPEDRRGGPANFCDYLAKKGLLADGDTAPAVKGVLGMMRFGHHDSPILLEALGDLLLGPRTEREEDAKLLAARAYLKASYEAKESSAREAYREMARTALLSQSRVPGEHGELSLEDLEVAFKAELADAEAWYAEVREREKGWVRDGKDPEAAFRALYKDDPRVFSPADDGPPPPRPGRSAMWVGAAVGAIVAGLAGASLCVFLLYRRRSGGVSPGSPG